MSMSLSDALEVLARVHTRDDSLVGFSVAMGATPDPGISQHCYVEAWRAVRKACHMTTEPGEYQQ